MQMGQSQQSKGEPTSSRSAVFVSEDDNRAEVEKSAKELLNAFRSV